MDSRDREAEYGQPHDHFDSDKMVLVFAVEKYADEDDVNNDECETIEVELPAKYEVCGLCYGKGNHVNPSVDFNGISQEEMDDDPDFAEDYMSGTYDIICFRCHGNRVEPVIDKSRLNEKQKADLKLVEDHLDSCREYERESEYERKMGY